MNYAPENASELISRYMAKAEERLESAVALLDIGNFGDSISRSYYAILDAATACLIKKDIVPRSHSGAIRMFSLHYIKPGFADKKYQRYFAGIERLRLDADYKHERTFTAEEAKETYERAWEFVDQARRLLK
jgi:uncharacterized protein (UPF0332 family)